MEFASSLPQALGVFPQALSASRSSSGVVAGVAREVLLRSLTVDPVAVVVAADPVRTYVRA